MKKIIFILFLFQAAACKLSTNADESNMDEIFKAFNTGSGPGCAIAVIQNGRTLFKKGYGLASLEYQVPISTSTVFDICSLSKQFTGFAISTLVEEKKIALDDDIRKYLPDLPDFGKRISIRQLLHHTSGIRDWPETLSFGGWKWEDGFSYSDIMNLVKHQKELDFEPGSAFDYSNTGYNLLAAVVAKVSGKSFVAWTDERIFIPLHMHHSHFMENYRQVIKNMAYSYERSGNGFQRVPSNLSAYGSSSLFTSIDDLSRWANHLQRALAKNDPVFKRMVEEGMLNSGEKVHYGFGLAPGSYRGLNTISHTGGWAGYRSATTYFPDQQISILSLSNSAEFDPSINYKVADVFLKKWLKAPENTTPSAENKIKEVKVDSATAAAYVGHYKLHAGWILNITLEQGQLMTQATNEDKFPMIASSDSSYWIPAYQAYMTFRRDPDGLVNQLEYKNMKAPRIHPYFPTGAEMHAYSGIFYSEELASEYLIDMQDGKLWIHQRRLGDFELQPEETGSFSSSLGSLQFFRDQAGAIAGFRLSGGRVKNLLFVKRPS
jgi:CubicO group peptidase (beta-lactamase class C family)